MWLDFLTHTWVIEIGGPSHQLSGCWQVGTFPTSRSNVAIQVPVKRWIIGKLLPPPPLATGDIPITRLSGQAVGYFALTSE